MDAIVSGTDRFDRAMSTSREDATCDYTTAWHGDSRDPWPQPGEWRTKDESADVRGSMYWTLREYA